MKPKQSNTGIDEMLDIHQWYSTQGSDLKVGLMRLPKGNKVVRFGY